MEIRLVQNQVTLLLRILYTDIPGELSKKDQAFFSQSNNPRELKFGTHKQDTELYHLP